MILLSKIVAGTMTWGIWGKCLSTRQMSALINVCLENGIDTFDHADIYGGYTTEAEFGAALRHGSVARERIKLITKCCIQYPSENRDVSVKHYDCTASHIVLSVENSLRNFRTDHLDVLLLHRPSPLMNAGEIADTVGRLKKEGKVLDFGVSNFSPLQTELIRQQVPVSYNQIQFSLTHTEALTDGSLDYMQLHQIKPMAWNPLGILFREETAQTSRIKTVLAVMQEKYNAPADVLLLAWILKHPSGIMPVFGTTDPKRIKALTAALKIDLALEDWFILWVESRGSKVP